MIKICVAGVSGKVGKPLSERILKDKDFQLVGAISRSLKDQSLSNLLKLAPDLKISGDLESALKIPTDVLIDYTSAESVKEHVLIALNRGVHVVVGSSGLTDRDYEEIDLLAKEKKVGVFAAGNFSITAALMQWFSTLAAKYVDHWEVLDFGNAAKKDAPSGTSKEMAYLLSKVKPPKMNVSIEDTLGDRNARGATLEKTQVHSIRLPGFYSSSEVIFGMPSERLSLRHDSLGAEPYISGTLLAAKAVTQQIGLTRGLISLLQREIEAPWLKTALERI